METGLKDLKIPNVLKVYYGEIKAKKVINDDEVYAYPEYESAKEISLKFKKSTRQTQMNIIY